LQSHAQPAANLAALEAFDGHARLRNGLRRVAEDRGEWAGIPMPMEGEHLVVEPTYPKARELMEMFRKPETPNDLSGAKIRNTFHSGARMCDITIFEHNGKVDWGIEPHIHHFLLDLRTLGCADAWGIEQETNAVRTLAEHTTHRQFKHYMLTGMLLESSKRSRVTYMFRRLKPTVAMHEVKGEMRILCALCMHPIAYYAESWAGAMCPTDDVLAHLMLMRGDEPMFWRRCTQHPAWRKQAGL
jgi:hypothetical protein